MNKNRWAELTGMAMIGSGILGMIAPKEHCRLWGGGPAWWRRIVDGLAENPNATRCAAAAELLLGLWISQRAEKPVREG